MNWVGCEPLDRKEIMSKSCPILDVDPLKKALFVDQRKATTSLRSLAKSMSDIIDLSAGDPGFDTPDHIRAAAKKAIDEGFTHYVHDGLPELKAEIANKLERENKIGVDPQSQVIVTNGVNEAIFLAMQTLIRPGDEVIVPNVTYQHHNQTKLAGGNPVLVGLREENEFSLKPKDVEANTTSRTRMIVVSSPHNPTGSVLNRDDLEGIAEIAVRHNLLVLSDEIYEKFVYDDSKHISIGSMPGMEDRTITMNGFSKAYGMTGWRVGYIAASKNIIDLIHGFHRYVTLSGNSVAQKAAVAALRGPQEAVTELVRKCDAGRRILVDGLSTVNGVHCCLPKGTFFAYPNVKKLGSTSYEVAKRLLNEARVLVHPGTNFGEGEGYLRVSYHLPRPVLNEAVMRIETAVDKWKGPGSSQNGPGTGRSLSYHL